jgi:hypothetical protein
MMSNSGCNVSHDKNTMSNILKEFKLKLKLKLNYDRQSASLFWCQAPIWDL